MKPSSRLGPFASAQVDLAQKLLDENDPKAAERKKKREKKDKKKKDKKSKKKKKCSSSSNSSSENEEESESVDFLSDLQMQCGLKPKFMNLKDLVRMDDLKPESLMN